MPDTSATGSLLPVNDIEMYYEARNRRLASTKSNSKGNRKVLRPLRGLRMTTRLGTGVQGATRRLSQHRTRPAWSWTLHQSGADIQLSASGPRRFCIAGCGRRVRRFKAIGLSGGATTLLHMAIQQPERIEAMVLVSAGHYFPAQARKLMPAIGNWQLAIG